MKILSMLPSKDNKNREKRAKSRKNPYVRILTLGILSFISVFLLSQSIRSVRLTYEKLNIFELAKKEVDELRLVNITLLQEKEDVITDDYVETVARNRLNYSKEGEISFIIPEDVIEDPILDRYLDQFKEYDLVIDTKVSKKSGFFDSWLDFFITGV